MRIGVDIGGTFTDLVLEDETGHRRTWKAPSTPPDFGAGVLAALDLAAADLGRDRAELLGETGHFVHGTTVTTNVVLTRTGERVGLITTRGFADTYPLARQYRGQEQDPSKVTHPVPLIGASDTVEVSERVDYAGRVAAPLNEDDLRQGVSRLLGQGVRAFAVCFLWSFRNADHERRAKELILEMAPDAYVSISAESCPVLGEYERTSTTAINAYAGPALKRYAERLDEDLRDGGLSRPILLMKSDGGAASIASAVTAAAQTVYSGPAAGVVAAHHLGERLGEENLITFDMGGTSTDVALVHEGRIQTTSLQRLDRQALAIPMIDVTSVGAGGGSLGWVGVDGTLRTGPHSAGAVPGPACYGKGGTDASVTDANVVLGLIDPGYFLGGQVPLDADSARRAVGGLGERAGLSTTATAHGMFRVVNSVMADAIRLRTVFAGLDPRTFTLVSFGGAGGLHCAAVAAELGIRKVIVPTMASVFSAAGLISSDLVYSYTKTATTQVAAGGILTDDALKDVNGILAELDARARADLAQHDVPEEDRVLRYGLEMSYLGQILNFQVDAPARSLGHEDIAALVADFDERYRAVYGPGAASPENGYTLKNYSVTGIGRIHRPSVGAPSPDPADAAGFVPKGTRAAAADLESAELTEIQVYDGRASRPGARADGPALIEYPDTNVLVPNGFTAAVDVHGNVVLEQVRHERED
ncbi:hydantoinase/oxoprolinase family protein [Streptomyces sp. NPDC050625]|uniref:hydantoinase/oxoprolinase family protein n=1 Tax=Streptomyces sp. NPDC050625 TaxID=3154629 RepID=UPI0034125E89